MKINKIKLLKTIDAIAGPAALKLITSLKKPRPLPENLSSILIIRPGGIGDAVHLLPSIGLLKRYIPDASVHVLAERRNAGVFSLCTDIEEVFLYDKNKGLFKCLKNRYDIVIDTEQWHRLSASVTYLTGAPVRAGFGTNERKRAFNVAVQYSHDDYEVYSFFNLIKATLGFLNVELKEDDIQFSPDGAFIEVNESEISSWLKDRVSELKSRYKGGYVVISPGATVRERRWGGKRYAEVAQELINKGFGVLVVGAEVDREDADIIVSSAQGAFDLTGKTSLMDLAYILKKARLFIGPDSGVLHIAVGAGAPTVSLFGSGIAKKWAPGGKKHIVINKNLPCSPCTRFGYTPKCPYGIRCLKEISSQEVLEAAFKLLKGYI
ncbi:MAG: glycosyltransferase family 9 protein [Nitrospirae bacterium]|nr:MAG: glycosyltransferase family 9 protein [Nitrospirota bacterium]